MTQLIVIVVIVALLLAAFRLWLTAVRLDRLHVRTEAAWAALDGALYRRSAVSKTIAAAHVLPPEQAAVIRGLATAAETAGRARRAQAEDALMAGLSALPADLDADLDAELTDAQERLVLANRFYNDAVRDTRALREVWFTRLFRLAGSAALPDHLNLTEYHPHAGSRSALTSDDAPSGEGQS